MTKSYLILLVFIFSFFAFSHPGRTNSKGCHNNTKTNEYHCHAAKTTNKKEQQSKSYDRKNWSHWEVINGQNTRQRVLIQEGLIKPSFNTKGKVISGKWYDPYTDKIFTDPSDLDIDHFVPLKAAYLAGADDWNPSRKKKFANYMNDENHLIAVAKSQNRSKGAKNPLAWLPPNNDYHCFYVQNYIDIKEEWLLDVSPALYEVETKECST